MYDYTLQVDEYAALYPNFLMVFAAGNTGDQGACSVITPGSSYTSTHLNYHDFILN
jgi:hypothetical protein